MSEQLTLLTVLFAVVLAFALLIERALEVMKATYDVIDSKLDFHRFWTKRTYATQQYLEKRLRVFDYVEAADAAGIFNRFDVMFLGPADGYQGTVPTLCGDLVRAVWVRLGCKVLGALMGIGIAFGLRLDVVAAAQASEFSRTIPTATGMLLTGLAMGLGSGPVHKLITTVEKRRAARAPQVVTNG